MEQRLLAVFKKEAVRSNFETFATNWNYNTATQTWPHCENETFPNYMGRCRMVLFSSMELWFQMFYSVDMTVRPLMETVVFWWGSHYQWVDPN